MPQVVHLPRIAIEADGVLTNIYGRAARLIQQHVQIYIAPEEYHQDSTNKRLTPEQWQKMEYVFSKNLEFLLDAVPFADVDLAGLNYRMAGGEFNGYFVDYCLDTFLSRIGDATFWLRTWLQMHNLTEYSGIFVHQSSSDCDLCADMDAHLVTSTGAFKLLGLKSKSVYLIDRPWNRLLSTDMRVHSLDEFLDRVLTSESARLMMQAYS